MIKIILSEVNIIIKNQRSSEASTPLKIEWIQQSKLSYINWIFFFRGGGGEGIEGQCGEAEFLQ